MSFKSLRFVFIVQGEGRGHMTQAIALYDMLVRNGHQVEEVWLGRSDRREVPAFFFDGIKSTVVPFQSPNFITDKNDKSIDITATLWHNLKRQALYFSEMKRFGKRMDEIKPDYIINFYDLLIGLYNVFHPNKHKFVSVAHQFLVQHPETEYPQGRGMEWLFLQINTRLTGFRAKKRLALSFYPLKANMKENVYPVPPLLRKEIKELQVSEGDYLLAYSVNPGYGADVKKWHESNRHVKVHYFWDGKQETEEVQHHENLTFHKLNGPKFLQYMANCKGYVSSAGFESVCEAMYLGKPALLIPTEGQYEQECNAIDARKAGAGIISKTFDLSKLVDYLPNHHTNYEAFRDWADSAEVEFLKQFQLEAREQIAG